jgi:hypothetical protein
MDASDVHANADAYRDDCMDSSAVPSVNPACHRRTAASAIGRH